MSKFVSFLMLGCLLNLNLVQADDPADTKAFDDVVQFVETNLIGRTLETKYESTIAGSVDSEFHRRKTFSNFLKTDAYISFDETSLIDQKLWDLDTDGKRVSEVPKTRKRIVIMRTEIYRSNSTGKAIGSQTVVSSNRKLRSGGADYSVQMSVEKGQLVSVNQTPLYYDSIVAGGEVEPSW